MSYTKEMCLCLLDNPDNIEAESLTESVERQVFQAMKGHIHACWRQNAVARPVRACDR